MITRTALAGIVLWVCALTGCGLFDSGVEWSGGPYELHWIDTADNVRVGYKLSGSDSIGRIAPAVYAVGWDGRYLVAKQHPNGDKAVTNFYIIDSSKDSPTEDASVAVIGPLREDEFQQKQRELHLPAFTKVLESLQ
jgi:hypothetical protein